MNASHTTQQLDLLPADTARQEHELEQVIEQIGARYISDLRTLIEGLSQLYEARLAGKDEQIAELQRRLADADQERDADRAELREFKRAIVHYIADLRMLSEDISRRMDLAGGAEQEFEVGQAPS